MSLTSGTTLGPYQIDAPLGAGGMGEVYKATDTRLDRSERYLGRSRRTQLTSAATGFRGRSAC